MTGVSADQDRFWYEEMMEIVSLLVLLVFSGIFSGSETELRALFMTRQHAAQDLRHRPEGLKSGKARLKPAVQHHNKVHSVC